MKTKNIIIGAALVIGLSAGGYMLFDKSNTATVTVSTSAVTRGNVNNTVTATGTLEATETVVVGTQVSGVIENIYVDFNSPVTKGQLIAELDKSTLQSSLKTAEADVDNAKAELAYQKATLARMKVLFDKDMLAESEYDLYSYNYKKSMAQLKSAEANYDRALRNLSYANIYAPIDGLVLNRAVEEGQTVQASMNTPELFTITNDLKTMEVEANIDEADIGLIVLDQRVTFTVDAFPDDEFEGAIAEIRLQPNESSNVITYTVIVSVENLDYKLKPGMTASITDYVSEANNVLVVPGKALRFEPEQEMMEAYMKSVPGGNDVEMGRPERGEGEDGERGPRPEGMEQGERPTMLWIKDGDHIRPVPVTLGLNDGTTVQILSGVEENTLVVTSMELATEEDKEDDSSDGKSPFVQEGGKRGGGGPPPGR